MTAFGEIISVSDISVTNHGFFPEQANKFTGGSGSRGYPGAGLSLRDPPYLLNVSAYDIKKSGRGFCCVVGNFIFPRPLLHRGTYRDLIKIKRLEIIFGIIYLISQFVLHLIGDALCPPL